MFSWDLASGRCGLPGAIPVPATDGLGMPEDAETTKAGAASTVHQAVLGEGIRWDARLDEVLAVDILAGRVYRGRVAPDGGLVLVREYQVPGTVGAIVPVDGHEGWVLATGRGFAYLSRVATSAQ